MKFSLTIIALLHFCLSNSQLTKSVLKGYVTDPEIKSIILKRVEQDLRHDSIIQIPVYNQRFNHHLNLDNGNIFELMLGTAIENGGGRIVPFFIDSEEISLVVNSENDFDKNTFEGDLNRQYKEFITKRDSLFKTPLTKINDSINRLIQKEMYYSPKMLQLKNQLRNSTTSTERNEIFGQMDKLELQKLDKSKAGIALNETLDKVQQQIRNFQQDYISQHRNLVAYHIFILDLIYDKSNVDVEIAKKNVQILSAANKNHPYNKLAFELVKSIESVDVGKSFTDFTVQDLTGNTIRFSERIQGKTVLLDLWATWCAPCIAHSREMVPIYHEFKDKGFMIFGVAGEFKNSERLVRFLENEKWPWQNYLELDRHNSIWLKYGIENNGGGTFLIGHDGKILAINPSAKEVRLALQKLLK